MTTTVPVRRVGFSSYEFAPIHGVIRRFRTPQDVLDSFDLDLDGVIALVDSGGTTFLSPILGRLRGIVCTSGTTRSHLAIVSREYEVPCLLSVDLGSWTPENGEEVTMTSDALGKGSLVKENTIGVDDPGAQHAIREPNDDSVTHTPIELEGPRDVRTSGSAVTDWWNYIRTVGDDIARKPFPSSVGPDTVARLCAQPLTDEGLNDLILHMGRSFKPEMTRRSGFTSELFPMMPYIAMSTIEDFHTYPPRVRAIEAERRAEDIGAELRRRPGLISPLWIWMVGYHYLCGREQLITLGRLRPDEDIDDIRTVIDFWRRLSLGYRGDGTLDYKDAGFTNRYLPAPEVDALRAELRPLFDAGSRDLKQLNATLSAYGFMYFTDSRVGVCDNGPYADGPDHAILIRDFLSLDSGQFSYPWARDCDLRLSGVTMALRFPRRAFGYFEINDWGTTFTEPDQLLGAVTDAAVIGWRADGSSVVLESAAWGDLEKEITQHHLRLYQDFTGMDRQDRIFSATRMYSWGLRPFAKQVGVDDEIDWSISERTMSLYPDPLDDDDQAGALFGGSVIAHSRPSAFTALH